MIFLLPKIVGSKCPVRHLGMGMKMGISTPWSCWCIPYILFSGETVKTVQAKTK